MRNMPSAWFLRFCTTRLTLLVMMLLIPQKPASECGLSSGVIRQIAQIRPWACQRPLGISWSPGKRSCPAAEGIEDESVNFG